MGQGCHGLGLESFRELDDDEDPAPSGQDDAGTNNTKTRAGAILFDATVSPQVDHDWFAPDYWRGRGALRMQSGGRGGVAIISSPAGECVLRHYHRGGLVAALMRDRYLWTGADRSRGFAEFRLLGTDRPALDCPGRR